MTQNIEDLWALAARAMNKEAKAPRTRRQKDDEPAPQSTLALYANPENWLRGKAVALVHQESATVLGNFIEFLHKSVPGCSKLVRTEELVVVSEVRYESGSWWLGESRHPEPTQVWHEDRPCILHVHLDKLGLHAPATELIVSLSYGSIARATLAFKTMFAQADSEERLVTFPAGTNLLEVMSRDCKIKLREELGL